MVLFSPDFKSEVDSFNLYIIDNYVNTLYNVCAVPWGVFSAVGDIMSTVGGYLEYRGVFSTVGDIMINVGGYLEYRGGMS